MIADLTHAQIKDSHQRHQVRVSEAPSSSYYYRFVVHSGVHVVMPNATGVCVVVCGCYDYCC